MENIESNTGNLVHFTPTEGSKIKSSKTDIEYLDLLPASSPLAGAEIELVSMFTRESLLQEAIKEIYGKYKYIMHAIRLPAVYTVYIRTRVRRVHRVKIDATRRNNGPNTTTTTTGTN